MMRQAGICVLLACAALAAGDICKLADRLQAVTQSYKIDKNHAMFGLLGACPPVGEELDDDLRYEITDEGNLSMLTLLDVRSGEFSFEPAPNFTGIATFSYRVSDSRGRTSQPATVTIHVRARPGTPLLELRDITAMEGTYVPIGMRVSVEEGVAPSRLTVTLCDCNEVFTCNTDTALCSCLLMLPHGWELAEGLKRRLNSDELMNLSVDTVRNLTLKTQMHSDGQHCFDVHAVNWNVDTGRPLTIKRKLIVNITSSPSVPINLHAQGSSAQNPLRLETTEGQAVKFGGLRIRESDEIKGTYRVQVTVDQGGTLWVKQDERSDVIFFPKETNSQDWVLSENDKRHRQLQRFGDFYETFEAHSTNTSNNGKKHLSFVGSLDGINHVLTSMVYVPWCPQWPTPPNWNLPESSWMDPSNSDQLMSDNPLKPAIWPPWYPRFWYPFPRKSWTWWPRVLPPWWLNQTCHDWTSRIHLEMREITPEMCDVEKDTDVVHWYTDVHVNARGAEPKSLIADNLFNYFPPTARSFQLKNLYIRSKEETFKLRFTLEVVENEVAIIENTDTKRPSFTCTSVRECTDQLQKIQVHLIEGTEDICKVTIEIRMYKDNSERLSDYMMLWAYKTAPKCVNYLYHNNNMAIDPPQEPITVWQGETVPLALRFPSPAPDQSGILHTIVYADHGLVTVSVPDGLRVYLDHMGQHDHIPTYFCMSGPTDMVLEALRTAKFTPFKNFKGRTTVKIDYSVPFTALNETYGTNLRPPMRQTVVNVDVVNGERPYLPLLVMPSKVCTSEMDLLPLDMIRLEGRYAEDEKVTVSVVALKGSLIVEQSRIPEIYECPEDDTDADAMASCSEECSFHTACPGTQLCCQKGCSRVCTEPEKVASVESHTGQNAYLHGKISTINRVLEAENLWYLAKPCQTDDAGEIVTDRVIEPQEDAIRIQVIPARNPEGDSAFGTLFVNISCTPPIGMESPEHEDSSERCREEWGMWLDCQVQEGICGRGTQARQGRCGAQLLREIRPCMVCACKPMEDRVVDPSAHMRGCTSDLPVMQCPEGCQVDTHHLETYSFTCVSSDDESPDDNEETAHTPAQPHTIQKTKDIEVHDTCICTSCLTYG